VFLVEFLDTFTTVKYTFATPFSHHRLTGKMKGDVVCKLVIGGLSQNNEQLMTYMSEAKISKWYLNRVHN
jgi:hypothetical protein